MPFSSKRQASKDADIIRQAFQDLQDQENKAELKHVVLHPKVLVHKFPEVEADIVSMLCENDIVTAIDVHLVEGMKWLKLAKGTEFRSTARGKKCAKVHMKLPEDGYVLAEDPIKGTVLEKLETYLDDSTSSSECLMINKQETMGHAAEWLAAKVSDQQNGNESADTSPVTPVEGPCCLLFDSQDCAKDDVVFITLVRMAADENGQRQSLTFSLGKTTTIGELRTKLCEAHTPNTDMLQSVRFYTQLLKGRFKRLHETDLVELETFVSGVPALPAKL